jgi:hypothetical protein
MAAISRAYLPAVVSVVVPAHNEARVIGRLLGQLARAGRPGELDVIVVANGCTDDTAAVAASFGPPVRVVSIPVASKRAALVAGDEAARGFPRLYVDADVELGTADIRALDEALRRPGALAAGPQRVLALTGSRWLVRWYYDVWERLPEVRDGLFGRGVIGLSEAGHARVASLPPLLADDLAASLAFAPQERVVVAAARVIIHPPRTAGDLLRRRVRATVGVTQVERAEGAPSSTARTSAADLAAIAGRSPRMALRVGVFSAVAVLARLRARRAVRRSDYSTWLRDESSRG